MEMTSSLFPSRLWQVGWKRYALPRWMQIFSRDYLVWSSHIKKRRAPSWALSLDWLHIVGSQAWGGSCLAWTPLHSCAIALRLFPNTSVTGLFRQRLCYEVRDSNITSWCLTFILAPSMTSSSNVVHLNIQNEIFLKYQLCNSNLLSKKSSCVLSASSIITSQHWQEGFRMGTSLAIRQLTHRVQSCAGSGHVDSAVQIVGERNFACFLKSTCGLVRGFVSPILGLQCLEN